MKKRKIKKKQKMKKPLNKVIKLKNQKDPLKKKILKNP